MPLTESDVASMEPTYWLMITSQRRRRGQRDETTNASFYQNPGVGRFGPNYERAKELVDLAHPQDLYELLLELIESQNTDVLQMLGERKLLKDRTICVHGVPSASLPVGYVSSYFNSRFGEVEDACVQYRATGNSRRKANVVFKDVDGVRAAMMNHRGGDHYMSGSSWNLIQFCCCRPGLKNNNYSGMLINSNSDRFSLTDASASTTRRPRALTEADFAALELNYPRFFNFDSALGRKI